MLTDFPEDEGIVRELDGEEIALFLIKGKVYAISNVCPHQHRAVLAQGSISGLTVTCPKHGWVYDLRSGKAVRASGQVKRYEVKVENGEVFVEEAAEPDKPTWW